MKRMVDNVTSGDVPAATEASLLGKAQQLRRTFAQRSIKVKLPKFIAVVLVLTSVAIPVLAGAGVRAHRLDVTDGNVLVADPINQQLVEYNSLTEQVVSTINARQLGDAAFSVKQNGGGNPVVHDETDGAVLPVDPIAGVLGTAMRFPTTEIRVGVAGDRSFVAELPSGKVSLFDPTRINASGDTVEIGSAITDVAVDNGRGLQVLTTAGELVSVSSNDNGASKETSRVTVTKSAANARVVTNNNDTLIVEPGSITRVRNGVIVAKSETPNDGAIKVPEQSVVGDLVPVLSSAAGIVLLVNGDAQPQRIDLKDPNAFTAAPIVLNGRVYLRNDRTRQMIVLNAAGTVIQTIFIPGVGSIDVTVDEQRIWINPGGSEGLIIVRPDGSVITKARGAGDGSATGGVLGGGSTTVTDTAPPRTVATTSTTTTTTAVPAIAATKPPSSAAPSTLAATVSSTATPTTTLVSTTTISPGAPTSPTTAATTTTVATTTTTTTALQRIAPTPPVLTPPTLAPAKSTTTTKAPDESNDTEVPSTRPSRATTPRREETVVTRATVPPTTTTTLAIDFPVLPRPEPTTTTAAPSTTTPSSDRPGLVPTIAPTPTTTATTSTTTPTATAKRGDISTTTVSRDETTTTTPGGNTRIAVTTTVVSTSSTVNPNVTSTTTDLTTSTQTTTATTTRPTQATTTTRTATTVPQDNPPVTTVKSTVTTAAPTTRPAVTIDTRPTTSNASTIAPTTPPTTPPTTAPVTTRPATVAPTTPPTTVAPTTAVVPTVPPSVASTSASTTTRPTTTVAPTTTPTTLEPTTTAGTTTTTTVAIALPGAPSALNAFLTGGGKIVSMSWVAPSTGGPVTSYKITTSFGDNLTTASTSDAVSAVGENLGVAFTFTVEAIGPIGAGPMRSFSRTLGTTPPVTTTTSATTTTTVAPTTTVATNTTVPPTSPPPVTTTTVTTTTVASTTTEPTTTTTFAPTTTAAPTTVAPTIATTTVTTIPVIALPPGPIEFGDAFGTNLEWRVDWSAPTTGGIATQYRITTVGRPTVTTPLLNTYFNDVFYRATRTFTIVAINAYGDGPAVTVFGSNNGCPQDPKSPRSLPTETCQLQ